MRAGLLSHPEVIERINEDFVSTWILQANLVTLAGTGDELAQTLLANWEYPLDLMFLTTTGEMIVRLNSYKDFRDVHPDVALPPDKNRGIGRSHVEVFLEAVSKHFGAK